MLMKLVVVYPPDGVNWLQFIVQLIGLITALSVGNACGIIRHR